MGKCKSCKKKKACKVRRRCRSKVSVKMHCRKKRSRRKFIGPHRRPE